MPQARMEQRGEEQVCVFHLGLNWAFIDRMAGGIAQ